MDLEKLKNDYLEFRTSLFQQGILDDQYRELKQLEDDDNPSFVLDIANVFFQDCEKLLNLIATALEQPDVDYKKAHAYVHRLKGASVSIGAQGLKNVCVELYSHCGQCCFEGSIRCLQMANEEFIIVKNKLEILFKMEEEIVKAGGSVPAFPELD